MRDAAKQLGLKVNTVYDWKRKDEDFQTMLAEAEDEVLEALIAEGVTQAVLGLRDLMPKAQGRIGELLDHKDPRIRLQAASLVWRFGGPKTDGVTVNVGMEAHLGRLDRGPSAGD